MQAADKNTEQASDFMDELEYGDDIGWVADCLQNINVYKTIENAIEKYNDNIVENDYLNADSVRGSLIVEIIQNLEKLNKDCLRIIRNYSTNLVTDDRNITT